MALFVLLSSVFVAFSFVLADQDGRSSGYLKEKTESKRYTIFVLLITINNSVEVIGA